VNRPLGVRVLLLEDSHLDAGLIDAALRRELPFVTIDHVTDRAGFEAHLESHKPELVLSDYSLPQFDGFEALAIVRKRVPDLPFIFVSGVLGEEIAIESLRRGATDYVLKQRLARLPAVVSRAISEATERAERRRAEDNLRLLVAELSHRVKNTLATVLSIAQQTIRGAETLDAFEETFIGRVVALSEAHGLLFKANWTATQLADIVDRTFVPLGRARGVDYLADGPAVLLNPRATLTLSMVLHELAANAIKYGAFSRPGGRVEISWMRSDERVRLAWQESGGPCVAAPEHRGFGTRLLERSAAYELGGSVTLSFDPAGVRCDLLFPLHRPPPPLSPEGGKPATFDSL
jgi:two-component sensor histidine kinase/CheY-like chemotaxis protein